VIHGVAAQEAGLSGWVEHFQTRLVSVRRLAVLLVVVVFAIAPSAAPASTRDVTSTHAAIAATYTLARARVAIINVAQAKIESYKHKLAGECPGVGAAAQETEATEPMSKEVAVALWSITYGSAAAPIEKFAKAIKPLHWTSARVNRIAHGVAANLSALAAIRLPDLCADIRAWAATGFTTVPPHVIELDEHVEPLTLSEIPWKLVAPYTRGHDASLVTYIKRAETTLAEAEFMKGQRDWYQVLDTVGLPP
jgi:hypothetical protein